MIVSHDCEFNEGKRDQFLAARVRQISPRLKLEEIDNLRSGNHAAARARNGEPVALDTFFLDPIPGVFNEPRLVDFCTTTPFPMKMAADVAKRKRAELEHEHRVLLREKIALFFGRTGDDVPDDEKWTRPSPPPSLAIA